MIDCCRVGWKVGTALIILGICSVGSARKTRRHPIIRKGAVWVFVFVNISIAVWVLHIIDQAYLRHTAQWFCDWWQGKGQCRHPIICATETNDFFNWRYSADYVSLNQELHLWGLGDWIVILNYSMSQKTYLLCDFAFQLLLKYPCLPV